MNRILLNDTTLCDRDRNFTFKEKLEIARSLERLYINTIELPEINNPRSDILLVKTMSNFVTHAEISVCCGSCEESVRYAKTACEDIANSFIKVEVPTSTVCMEYNMHKKPQKMLEWIEFCVKSAKETGKKVELSCLDASRSEPDFLKKAISAAIESGASQITLCEDTGTMLPDDFDAFVKSIKADFSVPFFVRCNDTNHLSTAVSVLCGKSGIAGIKVGVDVKEVASLEDTATVIEKIGSTYGIRTDIKHTEFHRIIKQIRRITDSQKDITGKTSAPAEENSISLNFNDDISAVASAASKLGYDLSDEDIKAVYDEFLRVAEKKTVTSNDLEAIIASSASNVPETYHIENYNINTGNIISASAQITMKKDGKLLQGISIGDGPIDAAFIAIEQIIGHRYELDDFQIQSVTKGKEAVGSAVVKLRSNGKLYSGNGVSTDIIGASIRAYMSAVNKITYDEMQNINERN
ncbi:MAG: alpha-isopropylmalate synthase regulatory domain-containing protein [Clostridia bacterium]|nr:alpha-isopropylmalate synthase regulatory domain-containing protein [Clostridia bacterium]